MANNEDPNTSLTLKFEFDGKQYELKSLTTNDTVGQLRAVVCNMIGAKSADRLELKTLQPTKVIMSDEDHKCLSEIFSQRRERIVVEETAFVTNTGGSKPKRHSNSYSQPSTKHHKLDNSFDINEESSDSTQSIPESMLPKPKANSAVTLANNNAASSNNEDHQENDFPICSSTGYLLRHPVPSNNSCLFISVHFCLTGGHVDSQIGKSMRKIIADTVASDKVRFDDAFLGMPNSDYCNWILDDNHWGGGIELSILCKYYKTEIVAIDVKTTSPMKFGEDSHYPKRMLLIYDGLHYDPLKFQPLDDNQPVSTLFATDNPEVLHLAEELAKEAKQSHQFTDLNTLTVRCSDCNVELEKKAANEHAEKTGHVNFEELHSQ